MRRLPVVLLAILGLAGPRSASAQPTPAAPVVPPRPGRSADRPSAARPERRDARAGRPAAATSWRRGTMRWQLCASRSTDLRIALDEIERSEGQWRQALAGSLPTLTGTRQPDQEHADR